MARKITQLNTNYVNLDTLPKKGGRIDWMNASGYSVNFMYYNISGTIKIENVERINKITYLIISYKNNQIKIQQSNFKKCQFGKLVSIKESENFLIKWHYEIGENVIDDLYVIDRKIINHSQHYKLLCKNCGFASGKYYAKRNGKLGSYDEYWIDVSLLHNMVGCPCCYKNRSSIVVPGINDIKTTDPWMTEYFVDKSNAQKFSSGSSSKILMKCKNCGSTRLYKISHLKTYRKLPCICDDGYSIPNKFSYFVFTSMKNIVNYQREYNPDWLKPYFYDNYFEYKHQKYVVEMDGGIGHGNKIYGSNEKDIDGKLKDELKDKLAKHHNINVIRINAEKSDLDYLKENMLNSLSSILDFSNINWKDIYKKSLSNIIKNVCDYAKNNFCFIGEKKESEYINKISEIFNINKNTVVRYLKMGRELGWCNYITYVERAKLVEDKVLNLYNKNRNQSYQMIANELGVNEYDVANATKKLLKKGKIEPLRKREKLCLE